MLTTVIVYICSNHLLAVVWECDRCGHQHCADMCWVCCCWCRYNLWRNQQYSTQHNCQTHPAGLWQLRVLLITVICNGCIVSVCVCVLWWHYSQWTLSTRVSSITVNLASVECCAFLWFKANHTFPRVHFNLKFLFACWRLFSPRSQSSVEFLSVRTLHTFGNTSWLWLLIVLLKF